MILSTYQAHLHTTYMVYSLCTVHQVQKRASTETFLKENDTSDMSDRADKAYYLLCKAKTQ